MLYTCLCCGYKTLEEKPPGSFEICPICFWEEDKVQSKDPDYKGGANDVSLREAQENFATFGASEQKFIHKVRKPTKKDKKDPDWKRLPKLK